MKTLLALFLLTVACSDPQAATPPDRSDWECYPYHDEMTRAFAACVVAMSVPDVKQRYTAAQCEEHAKALYCKSKKVSQQILSLEKKIDKLEALNAKYDNQRLALCGSLMGTCLLWGVETKEDKHCDDSCDVGGEDISKLLEKEMEKDEREEKNR